MICFLDAGKNNLSEHLVHSSFSLIIADIGFFFTLFSAKTDLYAYLIRLRKQKKTRHEDRSPFV
ncbi:protein of unknown function [Bacillus velezensis]|nr:protein of unknown function [Bacillus velezensis]